MEMSIRRSVELSVNNKTEYFKSIDQIEKNVNSEFGFRILYNVCESAGNLRTIY